MFKKIISFIIAFSLVISMCTVTSVAAEGATLTIAEEGSDQELVRGDTLKATIVIPAMTDVLSGYIAVGFDKDVLTIDSITAQPTMSMGSLLFFANNLATLTDVSSANKAGKYSISIGNAATNVFDTPALTLEATFTVKDTATEGLKHNLIAVDTAAGYYFYTADQAKLTPPEFDKATYDATIVIPHTCTPADAVKENVVPATCGDAGSYDSVIYCSVCETEISRETITVPATGEHTPSEAVKENEVAATCGTDGKYDSVVYCSVCETEISREKKTVASTGEHNYATEKEKVPATCTDDGYVIMACGCGATQTTTLPATGHTEADSVVENNVAATCTTDGSYDTVVYCSVCKAELSRVTTTVPATGHTEADPVVENNVAATCTTDGSYDTVVYCSVCEAELSRVTTVVSATGDHVYATEKEKVEATCTTDGYVVMACGCGLTETTALPATGHTEADPVVENNVAATCKTAGSYDNVVYCAICKTELSRETIEVPVDPDAHVWDAGVVTTEPTKEAEGVKTYTCTICGETKTETLPKLPSAVITPVGPSKDEVEDKDDEGETDVTTGMNFSDVKPGDWFYGTVEYVVENGLMNGTSDTTFAPYVDTTRAMIVTILWRLEGEPAPLGNCQFTDVPAGAWYTEAVTWAAEKGIVTGISATEFKPEQNITREQFATILWRYAKNYKGYDVSVGESTNILSYTDAMTVSEYAIPAMQWACGAGLINGIDGALQPAGFANRAQAATILARFCQNYQ